MVWVQLIAVLWGCMKNIRAKPLPYGHEDYVALELYVAWRGNGLKVETPAYRN